MNGTRAIPRLLILAPGRGVIPDGSHSSPSLQTHVMNGSVYDEVQKNGRVEERLVESESRRMRLKASKRHARP